MAMVSRRDQTVACSRSSACELLGRAADPQRALPDPRGQKQLFHQFNPTTQELTVGRSDPGSELAASCLRTPLNLSSLACPGNTRLSALQVGVRRNRTSVALSTCRRHADPSFESQKTRCYRYDCIPITSDFAGAPYAHHLVVMPSQVAQRADGGSHRGPSGADGRCTGGAILPVDRWGFSER